MTSRSVHLWCISLLSALLALPASARAGWLDGTPFDQGWYEDPAPPVHARRRPVVVFPPPRDGGIVARTPDGELVIVYPDDDYGYDLAPDMAPGEALPPRLRPRRRVEAGPRPPAMVGDEPVVIPGTGPRAAAPRNPVRGGSAKPRLAPTRDAALTPPRPVGAGLANPVKKPVPPQSAAPKIVTLDPPRVAQARIALPVPRPNLESMDFAPARPVAPLDRTASEDRR